MEYRSILRVLGLLVSVFSLAQLPPVVVAFLYRETGVQDFLTAFLISLLLGLFIWWPNRNNQKELKTKEGFLIVVLFWVTLGAVGAIPFIVQNDYSLSLTDAFFESFSGLTTTGATVITQIEALPHAYLFYRQQLQWMGGMGIIVLAVAILPILGVGGMQLYRAEIPGPSKDNKIKPRIADTAKQLWYIYLGMTIACTLAYWLAGMNLFDAVSHAFSTVSIGGFSTYNANMAAFDFKVQVVCLVFLFLAAINFSLHFTAFRTKKWRVYQQDSEFKALLGIHLFVAFIVCLSLYLYGVYHNQAEYFLKAGVFQAVSIGLTAGFVTENFNQWPAFIPILLIIGSFVGGSAGSTAGGIKVIRISLLYRQGKRELNRLIHPRGMFVVRWGDRPVADRVIQAVWGFFAAYTFLFVVFLLAFILAGLDEHSAFGATAATLNNLGPGLGEVAANFETVTPWAKWVAILAMLFGRLEIFTLLVILSPMFWRR